MSFSRSQDPLTRSAPASAGGDTVADKAWQLRLYIAGQTPRSVVALANLHRICERHLAGRYHIEVIDLESSPQAARLDQILAVPTLIRIRPEPARRIIGDLSNTERVMAGLDISQAG